jgi:hypothetical protein
MIPPQSRPATVIGAPTTDRMPKPRGQLTLDVLIVVHPLRPAGTPQLRADRLAVGRNPLADGEEGRTRGRPDTHHDRAVIVVKPDHVGAVHAEHAAELLADPLEERGRRSPARYQGRDPAQRRLLVE